MTLADLKLKVPEAMRPWVDEYGPSLLAMIADETIKPWIDKLCRGKTIDAYRDVLAHMDNAAILDEWNHLADAWTTSNEANIRRMQLQESAVTGLLEILLVIALAAVGL